MIAERLELTKNPTTVFEVWKQILEKRQEVTRQTAKTYALQPHGETVNQEVIVLPKERIVWSDNETQFYGQPNEAKAIGARVEVRPSDYDPTIDYSGAYQWFCEGDFLKILPDLERSFIFFDFESPSSHELMNLAVKSLKEWRSNWYLLDSGGSFHLIVDKLVKIEELPKYYGALIMDIAKSLSPEKSKLYGHVGNYLIKNCGNKRKLESWAESVLEKFGHVGEPITNGKLTFPLDMRWVAHLMVAIANKNINDGYLRVSRKHGSVPILTAQQIDRQITILQNEKDPFDRKQMKLPCF